MGVIYTLHFFSNTKDKEEKKGPKKGHNFFSRERILVDFFQDTQDKLLFQWYKH